MEEGENRPREDPPASEDRAPRTVSERLRLLKGVLLAEGVKFAGPAVVLLVWVCVILGGLSLVTHAGWAGLWLEDLVGAFFGALFLISVERNLIVFVATPDERTPRWKLRAVIARRLACGVTGAVLALVMLHAVAPEKQDDALGALAAFAALLSLVATLRRARAENRAWRNFAESRGWTYVHKDVSMAKKWTGAPFALARDETDRFPSSARCEAVVESVSDPIHRRVFFVRWDEGAGGMGEEALEYRYREIGPIFSITLPIAIPHSVAVKPANTLSGRLALSGTEQRLIRPDAAEYGFEVYGATVQAGELVDAILLRALADIGPDQLGVWRIEGNTAFAWDWPTVPGWVAVAEGALLAIRNAAIRFALTPAYREDAPLEAPPSGRGVRGDLKNEQAVAESTAPPAVPAGQPASQEPVDDGARTTKRPRRQKDATARRRRPAAVLLVLACCAVGVGVFLSAEGDTGKLKRASIRPLTPPPPGIPVGRDPDAITVGGNTVWVANAADSTITRINATTGKVIGRNIRLGRRGSGPDSIALGDGNVWVVARRAETIVRINPRSGDVVGAPMPAGPDPTAIAYGFGTLWIANGTTETLTRIDAQSRKRIGTVKVGAHPAAITVGLGKIWTANTDGTVTVINGRSGLIDVAYHALRLGNNLSALAVGSGRLWFTARRSGVVWLMNPDDTIRFLGANGRIVAAHIGYPHLVGNAPDAVAAGDGEAWIANADDNTVTGLDGSGNPMFAPIRVGARPSAVAIGQGSVWITNADSDTVSRVDTTSGFVDAG